ncbi:MAG: DEAD/DEAH box helicase [Planctomycetales bacterium]|nr:DEAD/DEAH box helicase [Planctomycetales bacterium]
MKTFEELDLLPAVQRALSEERYTTPTPIQAQTIPAAMDGRDVLGCAQTGTGKTAAFALPILNRLAEKSRKAPPNQPLVLVLAPTRELAIQIEESFATYGRHLRLRSVLVYGGVSQGNQVRALNRGAHILVATPGRLLDLMDQGHLELDRLEVFVLDEADRMLDMGFMPALKRIISQLPERRQSLFFSATMPPKIMELAQQLLRDPVNVNVTPKQSSVERIAQQLFFVEKASKLSLLQKILGTPEADSAIVFAKTKRGANMLAERLSRGGLRAAVIHGNKSQSARQRALDAFKSREVQVLVATDIAARGIDIDGITHVVNYDMPVDAESYVHRIGRTGRAGADGIALSFCSAAEMGELHEIEQLIGKKIPLAPGQIAPRPAPPERRRRSSHGQSSGQSTGQGGSRSHGRGQSNARSSSPRSGQAASQRSSSNRSSRSGAHDRDGREQRSNDSQKPSPLPRKPAVAAMATSGTTASSFASSLNDSVSAQPRAKRPLQRKVRRLSSSSSRSR